MGPPSGAPCCESTVEHRRIVEAKGAQHPPQPRRPHPIGTVVEHDLCSFAHAERTHRPGEALGGRQREVQLALGIGKIVDQIGERAAGNMSLLPVDTAGMKRDRPIGCIHEGDGTFQNSQLWVIEMPNQPIGFDQCVHGRSPCIGFGRMGSSSRPFVETIGESSPLRDASPQPRDRVLQAEALTWRQ